MWDPQQYLRYADERSRPFADLVARIGAAPADVGAVVDLGCGPGHLTATLGERWPGARVVGVDSSPAMVERARADHPGLAVVLADVATWAPEAPVDVVVSNATLQWVPGHRRLLARFVSWLRPGGWLAVQMPGNHDDLAHRLIAEVATSPAWAGRVGALGRRDEVVADPADYADDLFAAGCDLVDAWETTYLHVLAGDDPVLDWLAGTGLRPILAALAANGNADTGAAARAAFLAALAPRLAAAYPARPYGTPFPFRRVFAVARRAPHPTPEAR